MPRIVDVSVPDSSELWSAPSANSRLCLQVGFSDPAKPLANSSSAWRTHAYGPFTRLLISSYFPMSLAFVQRPRDRSGPKSVEPLFFSSRHECLTAARRSEKTELMPTPTTTPASWATLKHAALLDNSQTERKNRKPNPLLRYG